MGQTSSAETAGPPPAPLQEAFWVPSLLAARRYPEAQRALGAILQKLEERGVLEADAKLLGDAALATLRALPGLASLPQTQQQFGFSGLGLVASVVAKTVEKPRLYGHHRQWLMDAVGLAAVAWDPGSALVNQPIDGNRFVLLLCKDLAKKERATRPVLADLVARCVCNPAANFWSSQYFATNAQGVLAAFEYGSGFVPSSMMSCLLRECHGSTAVNFIERVLLFLEGWSSRMPDLRLHALQWIQAVHALPGLGDDTAFTPATCMAAHFLSAAAESVGTNPASAEAVEAVSRWLCAGLRREAPKGDDGEQADLLMRGYVAARATEVLARRVDEIDLWALSARTLRALTCDLLLPAWLLEYSPGEMQGHKESSACRLLPAAASALASCIVELEEEDQVDLVAGPLEELAKAWSEAYCLLSPQAQQESVRVFFGTALFFLVCTVIREAKLDAIVPATLLKYVRALSFADVFREDTVEYHALCIGVVDAGAESARFSVGILDTLTTLDKELSEETGGPGMMYCRAARVHFLLGALASPKLIDSEEFFPAVWPVIVSRIQAVGEAYEGQQEIQQRAHALAAVCFQNAGTLGRSAIAREYLTAGASALAATPSDEITQALMGSAASLAGSNARRRDDMDVSEEDAEDAQELLRWAAQMLSARVEASLEHEDEEAPESLFKVFCAVACHVDHSELPEPFYTDCRMRELFAKHPPLRELWLKYLVSSFPEKSKEILILALLGDFPESSAASKTGQGTFVRASL